MQHSDILDTHGHVGPNGKTLRRRARGQFYTHPVIGEHLAGEVVGHLDTAASPVHAIDPFCGDGRLIKCLLEASASLGIARDWKISLWDSDGEAVEQAWQLVESTALRLGLRATIDRYVGDTFARAGDRQEAGRFDVVVTNPPWELLKPDAREVSEMPAEVRGKYVSSLRLFDEQLKDTYPDAQPSRRFAGWGTNLARVGTDVAMRLVNEHGACGVVSPASLFADSNSTRLRAKIFCDFDLQEIAYFPAEARLFEGVDVPCISFVAVRRAPGDEVSPSLVRFGVSRIVEERGKVTLSTERLRHLDYIVPASFGVDGVRILASLADLTRFSALESRAPDGLWAGRELDETRKERYLCDSSAHPFAKGVDIQRLTLAKAPSVFVDAEAIALPKSIAHPRLVWRDVSRPNQKRRVQATLIPPGWVTGNSLGVAHFHDDDLVRLSWLLALFSSIPFEYQLRSILATGHVSLSTVRQIHLPAFDSKTAAKLAALVTATLSGQPGAEADMEVAVARAYGLDKATWETMLAAFPKLTDLERDQMIEAWK